MADNMAESNKAAQTAISAMQCIAEKITMVNSSIVFLFNCLPFN